MKIRNVIDYVDELYENVFSETIKLRWLNQLEAELQTEVLLLAAEGITQYTQEDMDAELIAPAPFDKIYEEYLIWRMMTAQGEAERANNQQVVLDEAWKAYARFVAETVDPKSGLAQTMRYYLSAYQVAVKHGYTGTETEWLASLKGDKGEAGAGLNIKGQVGTEVQLPALDDSDEGTAYLVGTEVEALLYIWNGSEWFYKQPISVKGEPGKSITVASVSTSTEDGGTNVVTFSDGKTLGVKNGSKGGRGDKGDSVTIARITESGESGGENSVEFSDGNVLKIKNGKDGKNAEGLPETAADGGYYTPSVAQPDKNTMQVSFSPSKEEMPSVAPQNITLPSGEKGEDGGYYTPVFSNPDANRMGVTLLPSKAGMDAVPMQSINLPSGEDGGYYKVSLRQSGENGMRVDYTASKADMPIAPSDYIVLPKGDPGYTPQKGVDYFDGAPGKDGYTPVKGVDYFDGKDGKNGQDGAPGRDGEDYVLTDSDKQEIADLAADKAVLYTEQTLTETQKAQARANIGTPPASGVAYIDATDTESVDEVTEKVVRYSPQMLTAAQKAQARENIGATTQAYVDDEIADLKAQGVQQTPLYPEGETVDECLAWLAENGDQSKMYLLPDGFLYRFMETVVESGPSYTNLLPLAVQSDGVTPYVGDNGEKGYRTGWRLNSSRVEKEASGRCCTGFIPVKYDSVVRFKNIKNDGVNLNGYIFFYNADRTTNAGIMYEYAFDGSVFTFKPNDTQGFNSQNMLAGKDTAYMRVSTHTIDDTSIITVDEEITEGGGTTIVKAWTSTGHAFIPADYDAEIARLRSVTTANATEIVNLKAQVENLETGDSGGSSTTTSDELEILLPYEAVAVVGVEFNVYYKSVIRASRSLSDYDVKVYLSNSSITCRRYAECFRLTADADDVGDYTLTVEVRNLKDYAVVASKSMTLHIIANTAVSGKNVLFIGDSLTFSRAGLYAAEIQYNLSGGGMVSIGSQTGAKATNQIGEVKHEGYNGATVGGFLKANVTSAFTNPFYNPSTGAFDLAYFMSNQGYSKVDAVCLNLGHNNLGNEVAGVADLKTIITKIHAYNANIPVIISLITPLGDQNSHSMLGFSAGQMRYHWRQLIKAYIDAFDGGKISNVYLSTPYFNVDQDNDLPTETVAKCARDTTQIVRQNDSMHPTRVGTLKMADVYYAHLLYRLK